MTDPKVAAEFAVDKLHEYGLAQGYDGWSFGWTNAKSQFGVCKYRVREIRLSKPLTLLNDEEHVFDTILHEIAHALVGPGEGHGPVWKAKCREIGCRPIRCADISVEVPPSRYIGVCAEGCEIPRHRLSKRLKTRSVQCANHSAEVIWIDTADDAQFGEHLALSV